MCRTHPTPVLEERKRDKTLKPLYTQMRRQIAGELDSDPRRDVAHGRKHRITAVLEFRLAAALEVLDVAVGCEANRIPEANWVRTPSAFSERLQRQGRVEQPIRPNILVKPS